MFMWMVSYTPVEGPNWSALVKATTMEQAIEKAEPAATESGIDERRREETQRVSNMGQWPTVIVD
jgi:hypothetical protein